MSRIIRTLALLLVLGACTPVQQEQVQALVVNATVGIGTMLVCNQLDILSAHNKGDPITCVLQDQKKE